MDQSDFLRLMTTQLTTQDPFNPMDNTQMVAQMAQFSQVAGIAEMNQSLRTIAAGLGGSRLSDAASWIGRAMLVESDVATPLRDGSYAGEFNLAAASDQVTVNLVDAERRDRPHRAARPARRRPGRLRVGRPRRGRQRRPPADRCASSSPPPEPAPIRPRPPGR